MIYFVQAGDAGPIKIGYTGSLKRRLPHLQNGAHEPLKVLGVRQGDQSDEKALHRRFDAHRLRGEWFRPDNEILAFLSEPVGVKTNPGRKPSGMALKPITFKTDEAEVKAIEKEAKARKLPRSEYLREIVAKRDKGKPRQPMPSGD